MSFIKKINTFNKNCVVCKEEYETLFSQSKFCSIECKKENDKLYHRERHKTKRAMAKIEVVPIDTEYTQLLRKKLDIIERMVKTKWHVYCELCTRSDLELKHHHIIQISEAPRHENLNHPKNIIMLCTLCRRSMNIHKDEKRKKLVEKRGLKQLFPNYIFC